MEQTNTDLLKTLVEFKAIQEELEKKNNVVLTSGKKTKTRIKNGQARIGNL